eukprot:661911-Pelagomonas_calceolata.AAC.4
MEVNFKAEGTHMQADQQKSKHKGKSEHRGGDRSKSNSKAGEQGHSGGCSCSGGRMQVSISNASYSRSNTHRISPCGISLHEMYPVIEHFY